MVGGWSTKRVLIVVKTYPTPAHKGVEVSCTAGVTREGEWIRLFPVPFRFLEQEQRPGFPRVSERSWSSGYRSVILHRAARESLCFTGRRVCYENPVLFPRPCYRSTRW
jgi:hypothetical protein